MQRNGPGELMVPDFLGPEHADFSRAIAYVDGEFVPLLDARISVRDFGLTHADQTYDVLHVWNGGFFRLDDHMNRFARSLAGMRLDPGLSRAQQVAILEECVRRTGLRYALVYWACTRGAPPLGGRDPTVCRNTFLCYAQPLVLRGSPEQMRRGLAVQISPTVRRIPSDSLNPRWKNVHWGDFTRALFDAKDAGFDSTVLLDHAGNVTEGPGFNVLAVVRGELVAPAEGVLEGISALTMMELATELGLPARFGVLSPEDLRNADEAFITSTSCGLFPITRVDDRILSNGAPGPLSVRLLNTYYQRKNDGWHITPIRYE
ncbi:MAG: aminotransferase class IV [Alphaproteobacteria bacterium]|nr:aminotransferase class IV [Alphaproteobacteria bacterium]